MMQRMAFPWVVACLVATGLLVIAPAGPVQAASVELVVSSAADETEQFAASELERYLKRLFQTSTTIVSKPGLTADARFLIGSAAHHPALVLDSSDFPKLSDQGFVLRRMQYNGKPAIAIVGGSSRATMWGVYELVERYGVRYLLGGDVYPDTPKEFHLPEIDEVFEPVFRARWFKTMGDFAIGTEGWGMADYRPLLDQLAKLKFNRIRVGSGPSQPFLDLQYPGVKRQSATLWYGERFPITDDMPGRKLFGNEKEFWNPDLPLPEEGYEKLVAAGQRHCHELIAYAHRRGINASSVWSITDFPKDFRSVIPDARTVQQLGALTVGPGPTIRPDNPELMRIAGAVVRTILEAFREIEAVTVALEDHGMGLSFPWPGMITQYWTPDPLSKMRPEDRAGYQRALDAVRKVPTPSRPEGKAYVRYWAGRLEFAVGYLDVIQAFKKAATAEKAANDAKAKGDLQTYRTQMTEAIRQANVAQVTAFSAIEAYASVAKNRADIGTIATMAEFVYRPLKRKAEELRHATVSNQ